MNAAFGEIEELMSGWRVSHSEAHEVWMRTDHDLDFGKIFESGVMTTGEQFVQIWCNHHSRYEWHWVPNTAEHAGFSTYACPVANAETGMNSLGRG